MSLEMTGSVIKESITCHFSFAFVIQKRKKTTTYHLEREANCDGLCFELGMKILSSLTFYNSIQTKHFLSVL